MQEIPKLIRVNDKVVKKNPEFVEERPKIKKPEVSSKFMDAKGPGENGVNPYIDKNDTKGLEEADRMLEKLRREFFGNKDRNN